MGQAGRVGGTRASARHAANRAVASCARGHGAAAHLRRSSRSCQTRCRTYGTAVGGSPCRHLWARRRRSPMRLLAHRCCRDCAARCPLPPLPALCWPLPRSRRSCNHATRPGTRTPCVARWPASCTCRAQRRAVPTRRACRPAPAAPPRPSRAPHPPARALLAAACRLAAPLARLPPGWTPPAGLRGTEGRGCPGSSGGPAPLAGWLDSKQLLERTHGQGQQQGGRAGALESGGGGGGGGGPRTTGGGRLCYQRPCTAGPIPSHARTAAAAPGGPPLSKAWPPFQPTATTGRPQATAERPPPPHPPHPVPQRPHPPQRPPPAPCRRLR